jgi:hypothetical protein
LEETQTKPAKRAKVSEKKTEAHNVSGSAKKDCESLSDYGRKTLG